MNYAFCSPATNNAFGVKLFKQLAKDQPLTNISISPYSIATVLHMVGNGAAGVTKTEMQQVLGTTDYPFTDVNAANKAVAESLKTGKNSPLILSMANAIWYLPGTPINPAFIDTSQQFYDATVKGLNFADPHAGEDVPRFVTAYPKD